MSLQLEALLQKTPDEVHVVIKQNVHIVLGSKDKVTIVDMHEEWRNLNRYP